MVSPLQVQSDLFNILRAALPSWMCRHPSTAVPSLQRSVCCLVSAFTVWAAAVLRCGDLHQRDSCLPPTRSPGNAACHRGSTTQEDPDRVLDIQEQPNMMLIMNGVPAYVVGL